MNERVRQVLDRLYSEDAAQREANLPVAQRTRNLDRTSGEFLSVFVRGFNAQKVFEMGSSNGVSTIWFAFGLADIGGYVIGSELIPERAALANDNLREARLDRHSRVEPGDARQVVDRVAGEGPFDLVFIDAEKDDYVGHFEAAFPHLRPGGVIIADNVTSHDIGEYQALVRGRNDMESVTLTIGRGLEYTVKIR